MIITQSRLPFQYKMEKSTIGLTGFAGLPLYIELATKSGLIAAIENNLSIKSFGWPDTELILSMILINIAGGDCINDIERLEQDAGFQTLLLKFATHGMKRKERRAYERRWRKSKTRALPSHSAIHRYIPNFHSPEEENKRVAGEAFIPAKNVNLQALVQLNKTLINYMQNKSSGAVATLDQDATLSQTYKHTANYCYKKYKAYHPFNTYWAETGMVLHSEFRDGNVPAGFEQLRLFRESLNNLPENITKVFLRSDSAGYQKELLEYCANDTGTRFGVIEFAVAAKISESLKQSVSEVKPEAWHPIYKKDAKGNKIKTSQEWAEVCFVPSWAAKSKKQPDYRYLAIREALKPANSGENIEDLELPFQTIKDHDVDYKLFAIVTNLKIDGNELINWHRERCGKDEHLHSAQKHDFAGGKLPSNLFGANAAWWQIMILSFNLNRLMQILALPKDFKENRMKALRFHIIQIPGRVIKHARQFCIRVEENAHDLYASIRDKIFRLPDWSQLPLADTS